MSVLTKKRSFRICLDEFSCYQDNSKLKEILRALDGVPNADYLVYEDGVFVFNKLVALSEQHFIDAPDIPLVNVIGELVVKSVVSFRDALTTWEVVPMSYEIINENQALRIKHNGFNALLPTIYKNKEEIFSALEGILKGHVQPGTGDFVYRGQAMILLDDLDINKLPVMPEIEVRKNLSYKGYLQLARSKFNPAFSPISESIFNQLSTLEKQWVTRLSSIRELMLEKEKEIASLFKDLPTGNFKSLEYDEEIDDEALVLANMYPELSAISDVLIFNLYESYQLEDQNYRNYTPDREIDFLFYVIATAYGVKTDGKLSDIGRWIAFSIINGASAKDAVDFALSVYAYDNSLIGLAYRVSSIMRFIARDEIRNQNAGAPITTFYDIMRAGRKWNSASELVVQQTKDFIGKNDD